MHYHSLFGKLERTLEQIERSTDDRGTLTSVLERLVDDFRDDPGIEGGRLYVRRDDHFVLEAEYPARPGRVGYRLPVSYPPVQELLQRGYVVHQPGDPGLDDDLERSLGVSTFAAIRVGEPQSHIMAFSLRDGTDRGHAVSILNTIRHAINLKLRKQRLEDHLAEVREIQLSLLPSTPPHFHDYEIWARTAPAEEVGGDLYDFIPVSERSLGLAIADSAGHGLPAALQARDAIVGLRMGVVEQLRITATVEKLNRVISRSALTTRFISLFYGEIEPNGNLVYCNAGHSPPLLLRSGKLLELDRGGMVLGPNPDAQYERGYVMLSPGSVLLLYTDGIVEAENAGGEMFGPARLEAVLRRQRWPTARALVEAVFAEVRAFSRTDPPADDQTVVAVLRRSGDPPPTE